MSTQHKPEQKTLYIKTWGCQMNVYDSQRMADVLKPLGYSVVEAPEDADMMILNTCHIREKATDKVFSELGRMREHKDARKQEGKNTILAVAGCVAQAEGEVITDRAPYVDMVFGPQTYHELPEMVARATGADKKRVINTDFPVESKFDYLPEEQENHGPSAFLSIQEGCDKFCTFCVVPYTRGAEFSRPVQAILDEARRLADQGVREITLLGQNVNAYHGTGPDNLTWGLGRLLGALSEIEGVERLRYTTSHPRDVDQELIEAHRDLDKLMPFLHLPVQSGSDKILKAMNRKHTAQDYYEIVAKLRKGRPDLALSSDFIIGFPGETDEDFEQTMQLVKDIGYASAYSFKFSARPGTPAANMHNLVREDIKTQRLTELQRVLNAQQLDFNRASIGKTMPVLLDRKGNKPGQLHGRTAYNQSIHVQASKKTYGNILSVMVTAAHSNSLSGEIEMHEAVLEAG